MQGPLSSKLNLARVGKSDPRISLHVWIIHNLQESTQFPSMSAKEWSSLGQLDFHNAPKIADSKGSLQQDKTLTTMMENERKGQV
jgi:hypothetical protein